MIKIQKQCFQTQRKKNPKATKIFKKKILSDLVRLSSVQCAVYSIVCSRQCRVLRRDLAAIIPQYVRIDPLLLHSTLHTAHCTLHTENCTLYTSYCKVQTTHCTLGTAHIILYTASWILHNSNGTMHTAQYRLHTSSCIL